MDNFLAVLAGQYIVKQSCFVESLDVVDYRDMFIRNWLFFNIQVFASTNRSLSC